MEYQQQWVQQSEEWIWSEHFQAQLKGYNLLVTKKQVDPQCYIGSNNYPTKEHIFSLNESTKWSHI